MIGGTTRDGLALVHGELTRQIIGAFYDVYNQLGYGFAESIYQHALPMELANLNFGPQPTFRRMFLSSPQEGSIFIRA